MFIHDQLKQLVKVGFLPFAALFKLANIQGTAPTEVTRSKLVVTEGVSTIETPRNSTSEVRRGFFYDAHHLPTSQPYSMFHLKHVWCCEVIRWCVGI